MKQPRVSDFDPNSTLTLKSPLDGMPVMARPVSQPTAVPVPMLTENKEENTTVASESADERTPVSPPVAPSVRTPVRLTRTITRYAFEFVPDQSEILKKFSLKEQMQGEKGSMSQMVREALDMYIAKRKRMEE